MKVIKDEFCYIVVIFLCFYFMNCNSNSNFDVNNQLIPIEKKINSIDFSTNNQTLGYRIKEKIENNKNEDNHKKEKFKRTFLKKILKNGLNLEENQIDLVNNSVTEISQDSEELDITKMIYDKKKRANCFIYHKGYFYDLSKIKWSDSANSYYSMKLNKNTAIDFDLCHNILSANCTEGSSNVMDRKSCLRYSSSFEKDKVWDFIDPFESTANSTIKKKIRLTTRSGEECSFGKHYKTIFEIECDMNQENPILLNYVFEMDGTKCDLNIKIKSRYGCPTREFHTWIEKFGLFRIGVSYILIFAGIVVGFKGLYFNILLEKKNSFLDREEIIFEEENIRDVLLIGKIFLSILNGFNVTIIIYSFFVVSFEINVLIPIGLSLFLGLISYLRFNSYVTFQLVVYCFILTSLLYNIFFGIFMKFSPIISYYLILFGVLFISFFVRLTYIEEILNPVMIHSVSLLASYMIVRGISFFYGDYPDEGLIYEYLIHDEYNQVHKFFYKEGYIYFSSIIILYLAFFILNKLTIKKTKKALEKDMKEMQIDCVIDPHYSESNLKEDEMNNTANSKSSNCNKNQKK